MTALDSTPSTPASQPGTTRSPETTSTAVDTGDVTGFDTAPIEIGEVRFIVAVADRRQLRMRGLMGVEDLGGLDGMLFVMDETVQSAFTMRNTLIPLHIAFFDEAGGLVDVLEMQPCEEEPCPTYAPAARYRYAVEMPLGAFDAIGESDTLVIPTP